MTTQERVLVVDDDPIVAKSIDRVLTGKGYAVITAGDGPEALWKLAHEKYDAVFTDIRMPGMSGLEVTARIKKAQPWMPVVIVTGYGSPESEALAKDLGVAGFLHKPLSPEMIENSARDALLGVEATVPPAPVASASVLAMPVEQVPAVRSAAGTAKNVALFFAAPFIGLAYAVAFPFVGLALLARYGYRAFRNKAK